MPEEQRRPSNRPRFSTVLLLGLLFAVVLILGLEGIARLPQVQNKIPIKSFGFSNSLFEIKWVKLEQYVKMNGVPDIIIVGNSMVNTGIDPLVIEQQVKENTGKSLTVFNFGVEGLNLTAVQNLAKLIVKTYHPAFLIVGTDIRDYSSRLDQEPSIQFNNTAWLKNKLGAAAPVGWIIDHSRLIQYFLLVQNWNREDIASQLVAVLKRYKDTNIAGYELDRHVPDANYQNPDPQSSVDQPLFKIFKGYELETGRIRFLNSIIQYGKNNGTRVIFLEMPLQKTMYQFFDHPDQVREDFIGKIQPVIAQSGSKLIESPIYSSIPDADWGNRTHLNLYGAPVFSRYLADDLIKLPEIQGVLH